MSDINFEVSFTRPILPPKRLTTDSEDGYFTVPLYLDDGSGGELDFHHDTQANATGNPSTTHFGPDTARMSDDGFVASFDPSVEPPSIRVRCLQTAAPTGFAWPALEDIDVFEAFAVIVSREGNTNMQPQVDLNINPSVGETMAFPINTPLGAPKVVQERQVSVTRFDLTSYNPLWGTRYDLWRDRLSTATVEMQCYIAGDYPWNLHEVTYMGLRVHISTFGTVEEPPTYRRIFPRDDGLAGGSPRNYPPSKSVQAGRRTGGGYL